jgi:DNA-directed RNA polymerase specialized sigma24 family protein
MVETQEALPYFEAKVKTFSELYESAFPVVARFVAKHGGSFDDAQDIFQDALIIYHEKQQKDLAISESEEAYIFGIAKHLWIKKFKHDRKLVSLNDMERTIEIPPDYFPSISTSKLLSFLEGVGEKCLNLLSTFYLNEKKIPEITKAFKFRSEHSTSVQKFKCIEKLREAVKQKPEVYESLFE